MTEDILAPATAPAADPFAPGHVIVDVSGVTLLPAATPPSPAVEVKLPNDSNPAAAAQALVHTNRLWN